MKKITFICLLLIPLLLTAQKDQNLAQYLIGYWEGAFIKENSYQKIEMDISQKNGKLYGLQIMDEWHPTFGEFEVLVEIDSLGKINFGTGYGKATLTLDTNNLELIGSIDNYNPTLYLHLKKAADRPEPDYTIQKVTIDSDSLKLSGHLHLPKRNPTRSAMILVGGRSCYAGSTQYDLYAKVLRSYGITVLAYQKRGTGDSTGDCATATVEDLAIDLANAKSFLEKQGDGYDHIGVLGSSAGGWVMTKALEMTDFDFMISIVGPSTSVRDQQLQSAAYGADFYDLESGAKKNLLAYTELMFDAPANSEGFEMMNKLLEVSEQEGWRQILEDTDIPASANEINNLWVRRHHFDPKEVLSNYKNPYLAIYGERDWIVPPQENIDLLNRYFTQNTDQLTTVVAYNAEHGMEMEQRYVDLGNNASYWHFYRISPEVRIEIVNFLRRYQFIK